ncbi:hypothetical protein HHI36_018552 [Cryptolaemus montrouzieri]|uniref:Uncharacterized protein n=1 Tax=Cryptolaemus montrouzieri TaxID=559131 RepID=A0ABD2P0H2_9CUCU
MKELNARELLKKIQAFNSIKNVARGSSVSLEQIRGNSFHGTFITCPIPKNNNERDASYSGTKIRNEDKLAYFKHDTGHMNFAFVDYDGISIIDYFKKSRNDCQYTIRINTDTLDIFHGEPENPDKPLNSALIAEPDCLDILNVAATICAACTDDNHWVRNVGHMMPSSSGGSYRSLAGANEIYRPTTVAGTQSSSGFFDGVKRAFQFVAGANASAAVRRDERLIDASSPSSRPAVISSPIHLQLITQCGLIVQKLEILCFIAIIQLND